MYFGLMSLAAITTAHVSNATSSAPPGGGSPKRRGDGSAPLPISSRDQLRAMVDRVGEASTRRETGLSRHALDRCLAGLPIRRGTAALVTLALQGANA